MATITDTFDTTYDTAIWETLSDTICEVVSGEMECSSTSGSVTRNLRTKTSYDMTGAASVEIKFVSGGQLNFFLTLNQPTETESSFSGQDNILRIAVTADNTYVNSRVGGSNSTIYTAGSVPNDGDILKFDFPASGNDLDVYIGGVNVVSIATLNSVWDSRLMYATLGFSGASAPNNVTYYDNFSLTTADSATTTTQTGAVDLDFTISADWAVNAVDTTAPVLSSPTAAIIGETTVTPTCNTDTAEGTMYMVVVPNGDVPSVTQIRAGQQSSGAAPIASDFDTISSTGIHAFAQVTGLTASTSYELYFVHTDVAANDSTAATVGFTTNAVPGVGPSRAVRAFGSWRGYRG
jgi:hypothetical protein